MDVSDLAHEVNRKVNVRFVRQIKKNSLIFALNLTYFVSITL